MNRYEVNLYDKDNDHYTLVKETDTMHDAMKIFRGITELLKCPNVVVRRNDMEFGILKDEPFDWVEVYDNKTKTVIEVSTR